MQDHNNGKNSPTQNDDQNGGDKTTIGQYLRAKREKKNLTIKHLSQFTKINSTQLELLEKDLLSKLPNRAYVAGYVKAYSKALGFSQEEALRYLENTYRMQNPELPSAPMKMEAAPEVEEHKISMPKFKKPSKEAYLLMGIAGVMIAVTSLTLFFKKGSQNEENKMVPEIEATSTPSPVVTKIPVQTPTLAPTIIATLLPTQAPIKVLTPAPTPTPTPTPKITVAPTAAPTEVAKEAVKETKQTKVEAINLFPDLGIFSTEIPLANPVQTLKDKAPTQNQEMKSEEKVEEKKEDKKEEKKEEKKEDKKDDKKRTSFYKIRTPLYQVVHNPELAEKIPQNIRQAASTGKQNVYISTGNGRTWITYKIDKEPVKQVFLKENAGVLLSGNEVRLFLGNATAANVYLNNQPVDMQLKKGIKNLVFPESSVTKFAVPLFIFDEEGTISPSDEYMKKKGLNPL